ncbi:MAG: amidohydrolase [Clostridia bacterium]|nr:amidohydrolase [Clostridia bacterium]
MNTLFFNAHILTMDDRFTAYKSGWLLVEGDRIQALGAGDYTGSADIGERIDCRGGILLPGFINTHCHASMVPFRTMGDDCPDRLRRFLFPLENEAVTAELVYLGAKYGIAEMLLSGTTTFADMYYFEGEVVRACLETGMRGYLGETIIGQQTCDSPNAPYGGFALAEQMLSAYRGCDLIRPIIAPHGTTTCDADALRRCHELAVQYNTLMTLHVSEMDYEMQQFADMGMTPMDFLDSIGAADEHLLAAHCIHLTEHDIELMKKRGVRVAHCIGSNTKAGKGVAPIKQLHLSGIPIGLGTDGPSSGNTLSMFDQMRLFAVCHKTANRDRSLFPARDIVAFATRGGAAALNAGDELGQLVPGMRADVTLVSTDSAHMFPVFNPYSALVYSANASDVELVMTNGVIRVRNKQLVHVDLEQLKADLTRAMGPFMDAAEKYSDII